MSVLNAPITLADLIIAGMAGFVVYQYATRDRAELPADPLIGGVPLSELRAATARMRSAAQAATLQAAAQQSRTLTPGEVDELVRADGREATAAHVPPQRTRRREG